MTFQEFQATGVDCADLGAALKDENFKGQKGRFYLDELYLQDLAGISADIPRWYAVWGTDEHASNNLEQIERVLYDFAVFEGYFEIPPDEELQVGPINLSDSVGDNARKIGEAAERLAKKKNLSVSQVVEMLVTTALGHEWVDDELGQTLLKSFASDVRIGWVPEEE